jgi:hypothetical protein
LFVDQIETSDIPEVATYSVNSKLLQFGANSPVHLAISVTSSTSEIRDLAITESVTCSAVAQHPHQRSLSIIANFDTFGDPDLGEGGLNVATTAACSRVRLVSEYSISKRYGEEDHVYTMVAILHGRCPQSRRKHTAMR